jgi:hypothetical protein
MTVVSYHAEVELTFPLLPRDAAAAAAQMDPTLSQPVAAVATPDGRRGDLLLVRNNTRLLIDVNRRAAHCCQLRPPSDAGAHSQPLAAAPQHRLSGTAGN